jgi:hypothetical protein
MLKKSISSYKYFTNNNSHHPSPQNSFLSTSTTTTHTNKKYPIIDHIHSLQKELDNSTSKVSFQHNPKSSIFQKYISNSTRYQNHSNCLMSIYSSFSSKNNQSRNNKNHNKTSSKESIGVSCKRSIKQISTSNSTKDIIIFNSNLNRNNSDVFKRVNSFRNILNSINRNNQSITKRQAFDRKVLFDEFIGRKQTNNLLCKNKDVSFYMQKGPLIKNYNSKGGNYEQFLFSYNNKLNNSHNSSFVDHLKKNKKKLNNSSILDV